MERAFRFLKKLDRKIQLRINAALNDLKTGRFVVRDIKKIQGTETGRRLRIGRWRILFLLTNRRIEIVDIFLKKGEEDYRKRKKLF